MKKYHKNKKEDNISQKLIIVLTALSIIDKLTDIIFKILNKVLGA